jgi:Tol biopolymer transport system component
MRISTTYKLAAAGLALLAAAVLVASAAATSPGKPGSIAFRRYFNDDQSWGAVFTIAADGTGARQVTHPKRGTVDDQPDWAPDGSLLTFTRCAPDALCHIWVVKPDGSGLAPVGALCAAGAREDSCPDDANPSFAPDSKRISFTQSSGQVKSDPVVENIIEHSALTVMNVDGSDRRVIYQGPAYSGDLVYPMFSPNGRQILFERDNSGFTKPVGQRAVFVINADGTGMKRLTPWAEKSGDNPDWSPDGKWILFHSHQDDPSAQSQYFIIHPDGTGRRQLTHFPAGTQVRSASFSPDGKAIVFSNGPENGHPHVYTMRRDGSHVQRITKSPLWDSAPDWGPQ